MIVEIIEKHYELVKTVLAEYRRTLPHGRWQMRDSKGRWDRASRDLAIELERQYQDWWDDKEGLDED